MKPSSKRDFVERGQNIRLIELVCKCKGNDAFSMQLQRVRIPTMFGFYFFILETLLVKAMLKQKYKKLARALEKFKC